jgi:DNA-binding NarL/FixJ family response regulator
MHKINSELRAITLQLHRENAIMKRVIMETSSPINLLFIDDDPSYMAVAQHLLSKYQGRRFNIQWKQDGTAALEYLRAKLPADMLLIDYYLPEMNGLEVTKAIRQENIDVPIIFLTSNRDFRLAIEVMKYGVEDYIVKDEAVDSVLPRTILNILERVRLKRQITDQKKADLILQKKTDAIRELIVTVCHEFNNPLAAIKISTDIIRRQSTIEDDKRILTDLDGHIDTVEQEINRLRDIGAIDPDGNPRTAGPTA